MILTQNKLADWLSNHQSIGIFKESKADNSYANILRVIVPQIFEKYAVILHPFWINWKVKDLVAKGLSIREGQKKEDDFQRIPHKDFFSMFGRSFDYSTSFDVKKEIQKELSSKRPSWIWGPGEGQLENEEFMYVCGTIQKLYGDQLANFYYYFTSTITFDKDLLFRGELSEITSLLSRSDIRGAPSTTYSQSKEWCIISDEDLDFTFVAGPKELIDSITTTNQFEIFEVNPKSVP